MDYSIHSQLASSTPHLVDIILSRLGLGGSIHTVDHGVSKTPRISWPTDVNTALASFSSLLLSRLESSDTKVYEPSIRARLGTAAHLCEVFVLKPL